MRKYLSSDTRRMVYESIEQGKTLDDYQVYEVVPNEDGTGYTRVENNELAVVKARSKYTAPELPGLSDYNYKVTYDRGTSQPSADTLSGKSNIRRDTITNTRTNGIVLTLYDMHTNLPLANGDFTLTKGEDVVGTYTSDSTGRIVLLYLFDVVLEQPVAGR